MNVIIGILICAAVVVATIRFKTQFQAHHDLWITASITAIFGAVIGLAPQWTKASAIVLILAGSVVYCLSHWAQTKGQKKIMAGIGLAIALLTIAKFGPNFWPSIPESQKLVAASAEDLGFEAREDGSFQKTLTLRGPDTGVEGPKLLLFAARYPGWGVWFDGPDNALVSFGGLKKQPLNSKWGEQTGSPVFFGPKGTAIVITITPPH
jgi:uncharacterized membrane protein YphA (DoxX/SURF4 family)